MSEHPDDAPEVTPAPHATAEPTRRAAEPVTPAETPAYDESFETRFEREPGEDTTTFSRVDSLRGIERAGSGHLLDEFLVEEPDGEEPAGHRVSSEEEQDDEEYLSVWRPGRWLGTGTMRVATAVLLGLRGLDRLDRRWGSRQARPPVDGGLDRLDHR